MTKSISYFHLHLISDATGETLTAASRSACAQYSNSRAIEHIYPLIRSEKQLRSVLEKIDAQPGIVLYTVVDMTLAQMIETACKQMDIPAVSVLEPILTVFQTYLGTPAHRRASAQHVLNADYFRRIEALNFTMEHDDGVLPADIEEADVILVGISRTSKTPTSIYLANRGIKATNIPLVPGIDLPEALLQAKRPLIVGLVATVDRISHIRQNRILGMMQDYENSHYTDRVNIAEELNYARKLCARHGWPVIDVSRRSIEETAAAILALRNERKQKEGNT